MSVFECFMCGESYLRPHAHQHITSAEERYSRGVRTGKFEPYRLAQNSRSRSNARGRAVDALFFDRTGIDQK